MRDYGLMPWNTGDLTSDEWTEILTDQNDRWKAIEAAQRAQQQKRRR